jgi:hypothetical protein
MIINLINNRLHKFCHQVLLNDLFICIIWFVFLHKDLSSDQALQLEPKPVDQTEVAHQEMESSIHSTSMHFQKQISPIVDNNEALLKQHTE